MKGRVKHIGLILDGNRRFAKRLILEPWKGHELGAGKVQELLDWTKEIGVKEFTLYCLSCENIKTRPKNELEFLFKLFRKEFRIIDSKKIQKYGIKIRFIGNLYLLPKDLEKQCKELEKKTSKNKNYIINFALAYGGRQEIIDAIKKILKNKISSEKMNEREFEKNLWLNSSPDLIIRTGGEKRTSNFLPWQSIYSEWFFLNKMWPEFTKQDLLGCIKKFNQRKRRFGK
jgi:tritrans,polycis-undecaprenyl-diphosphate synthase [geranylgeranyl-diphosphate specific]